LAVHKACKLLAFFKLHIVFFEEVGSKDSIAFK
jgi:hypothetical protein